MCKAWDKTLDGGVQGAHLNEIPLYYGAFNKIDQKLPGMGCRPFSLARPYSVTPRCAMMAGSKVKEVFGYEDRN